MSNEVNKIIYSMMGVSKFYNKKQGEHFYGTILRFKTKVFNILFFITKIIS